MAYRLAIIGLGKIAQDQHLPVVAKTPDFELAAVVSPARDIATCRISGRRPNCSAAASGSMPWRSACRPSRASQSPATHSMRAFTC